MIKTIKHIILCTVLLPLFSCAISKAIYLGPENYLTETGSALTGGIRYAENINGDFPEAVYIKTRTQTFNSYHYYILRGGKIWYRSIQADTEPREWTLFQNTGLPYAAYNRNILKTNAVIEISADADELIALSEEGVFHRYCFDRNIAHRSRVWLDRQGWPDTEQLSLDSRTSKNLAWALGKRNKHVLYYEDPFGNQHHNGTMEIATTYVLLEDGQEICFSDTGLPADFSRNYIGPERGAFKAVSLSASASTMFVINDTGEMYTRMADFDMVGSDPMWFKYTYIPYKSDLPGTNYFSNLNEWGLPAEDWRAQPFIPLAGKAAITRHITILQNGHGNGARELRVAGFNEEGKTGYWTKPVFGETWEFKTVPLYFDNRAILKAAEADRSETPGEYLNQRGERGASPDKAYSGFRWKGDKREDGWIYEIPNFNILEGSCDFRVTRGDETCALKLHPVEMWTYMKRDYSPGRTGAPKVFFVTLEIPKNAFAALSEEFAGQLAGKFAANDKKLFHYIMAASNRYIMMQDSDRSEPMLFLTDGTISAGYPDFRYIWHIDDFEEIQLCYSPELVIGPDTPLTGEILAQKIALNKALINKLEYQNRGLKWSGLTAVTINTAYLPLHYFAALTPLRFLNMPKIRTMTRYGDRIVLANNAHIVTVSSVRGWIIAKTIEHIKLRISYYNDIAKSLSDETRDAPVLRDTLYSSHYSESVSDYWNIAGLPKTIQGTFYGSKPGKKFSRIPAELRFIHSETEQDISGWHLALGTSERFLLMLDPQKSAAAIYSRRGKTPEEQKLRLNCALFINDRAGGGAENEILDDCLKPLFTEGRQSIRVRVDFDGNRFEIRDFSSQPANTLIFRGSL